VRVIAAKTLRKRGYKVIEACDGDEAFEILEDGEHSFDLMISDVVMPGMDGPALLKKGRSLLGEARIVFISGYAKEEFSDLLSMQLNQRFAKIMFRFCSFRLRNENKSGTNDSRQSNCSRDFKLTLEGLREFLLEFHYGQKFNTAYRCG